MLTTVVIPAYNEEQYLSRCLEALAHQTYPTGSFEVIVVDNGSTDATAEIARRWRARVVQEPCKGVARARQTGFEAARGEIIASTDADTCVAPFWLARSVAHFREDPALGGVYGPVRWYDGQPADQWVLQHPVVWAQWLSHRARRDLWWGSNFAVRREIFWKAGGFPVDWATGEDTDLSLRVSRIARVRFDPDLVVYTSSRRAQEGWFKLARGTLTGAVERFMLRRPPSQPMVDLR
ncbi:MAG: glycosyltransferase family 2 protein [Anaerolineae bacterium]|nr:glycosyltransferase family 2 protein [Anaerolineae bacterium]